MASRNALRTNPCWRSRVRTSSTARSRGPVHLIALLMPELQGSEAIAISASRCSRSRAFVKNILPRWVKILLAGVLMLALAYAADWGELRLLLGEVVQWPVAAVAFLAILIEIQANAAKRF